jgi:hypothetical protein
LRRNTLRIQFTLPGKQIPNCRLRLYPAMYYVAQIAAEADLLGLDIASLTDKAAGILVDAEHP